jgi:hypothetical protein
MDCVALIRYIKKNSFHFGSIIIKKKVLKETGIFYKNLIKKSFVGIELLEAYGERTIIRDS